MSIPTMQAPLGSLFHLHQRILSTRCSTTIDYFPQPLLSILQVASENEQQHGAVVSDEEYKQIVDQMAQHMLSIVLSEAKVEQNGDQQLDTGLEVRPVMNSDTVYSPRLLDVYDTLVWGFNSPFLWNISEQDIQTLYSQNIGNHHCEIGVGTGLFLLANSTSSCPTSSFTLMDLNQHSLEACSRRIQEQQQQQQSLASNGYPKSLQMVRADITAPLPPCPKEDDTGCSGYDSVAANFLFHCLHGSSLNEKKIAFQNCAKLVHPTRGVFFGSTVLGKDMATDHVRYSNRIGHVSMHVLHTFNQYGVFGNLGDSFLDLECVLNELFGQVELKRVGYCGVWMARYPKIVEGTTS